MATYKVITGPGPWPDRYTFSPAVRAGNLLFISGTTATDDDGRLVAPGDIAGQARHIFLKFERLLKAAGAGFEHVVLKQDWHTPGHVSFASAHPGKKPFETIKLDYGNQVLWPDHCVQGTDGAAIDKGIDIPHAELIIRKGYHPQVDSYSAFIEADQHTRTGLDGYLKGRGIRTVYVVGLATDFCVAWTAIDAAADAKLRTRLASSESNRATWRSSCVDSLRTGPPFSATI